MPDFRQIQFNSERFVPGHYRIYNYRRSHLASSDINTSPYEYVSVGKKRQIGTVAPMFLCIPLFIYVTLVRILKVMCYTNGLVFVQVI